MLVLLKIETVLCKLNTKIKNLSIFHVGVSIFAIRSVDIRKNLLNLTVSLTVYFVQYYKNIIIFKNNCLVLKKLVYL
jgi:hypothetical protein